MRHERKRKAERQTIWAVILEGNRRLEIEGDVSLLRMLWTLIRTIDADDPDAADMKTEARETETLRDLRACRAVPVIGTEDVDVRLPAELREQIKAPAEGAMKGDNAIL